MGNSPLPDQVLLAVRDLRKYFPVRAGLLRRRGADVRALDGVSFMLRKGETLGVAGESGCGKTTLAQTITRLTDPTSGTVLLRSHVLADEPVSAPDVSIQGQLINLFEDLQDRLIYR